MMIVRMKTLYWIWEYLRILVKVLEHAKDHVKAELKQSKERLESVSTTEAVDGSKPDPEIIEAYLDKRI